MNVRRAFQHPARTASHVLIPDYPETPLPDRSKAGGTDRSRSRASLGLLAWYVLFWVWMAVSPVDRQNWVLANILPALFVGLLVASHRCFPLSFASYALITAFLSLHTIGVHYTYAQVPFGYWLEGVFDFQRNHFDRIVHFCFGLLLTYPMYEGFVRFAQAGTWLAGSLSVIFPLGLSGAWEVLEAWVARAVHPELGEAYLGSQGDRWDAQRDIAAALFGAILCLVVMALARRLLPRAVSSPRA